MIGRLLPRRRIHDDASAFVDGALGPRDREAFARHLAVCAACQSEVTQLRDTKGMLKALGTEALPRSFTLSPALAARPASRPGPTADAAGWGGPGVPRLAASVSIMMAAALVAAVVIDLDDGSGTAVVQQVSQTAIVERAAPVVTEAVASADDPTVTQAPEAAVRVDSVLLVEGPDAPAAPEQEAPRVVEVEPAPAPELEEALEEVIEETFVAAVPELLDIFLPGSDGFGSVALVASEAADDPASRADDIAPEGNVGLGVAAIEAEAVAEFDKETPVDAPGDDSLGGQEEPAAVVPPETSEDGGPSLGEDESALRWYPRKGRQCWIPLGMLSPCRQVTRRRKPRPRPMSPMSRWTPALRRTTLPSPSRMLALRRRSPRPASPRTYRLGREALTRSPAKAPA